MGRVVLLLSIIGAMMELDEIISVDSQLDKLVERDTLILAC